MDNEMEAGIIRFIGGILRFYWGYVEDTGRENGNYCNKCYNGVYVGVIVGIKGNIFYMCRI